MWRDRRLTYGDVAERSRRLAAYLHGRGLRLHRERCRAPGPRVGPGPRRPGALQRQRVPGGDAGLVPGPGRPVQRQLPLRRRGAALPAQRRPAAGADPALLAGPHPRRGAAHAGLAPRRAAPGGRRIGPHPPPRGGVVRGGTGRILARRGAGRALPRRPVHPLHGGHHGHAQGRAVAPARHLHGRHGRAEGGHVGDRHQLRGHHRAAGRELPAQADAAAAAHARRGAVGGLHADGPGGDDRLPRRHAARRPRRRVVHRRAGGGQHHDRRGRRRAAPAAAPARQEELRPLLVLRRGQRRRAADPGRAGHGARAPAQSRHLRLGRLVGDRGADARHLGRRRRGRDVPARAGHRRGGRVTVTRARAGARGQRVAGPDRERAAGVSR